MKYYGKFLDSKDLIPREFVTNTVTNEYDATKTYALDDLVMHDEYMYKCNTAITTAEAWTPAHWTKVQVSDLIKNAGVLVVTGTLEEPTQYGSFTINKSIEEIKAAFIAKKPVLLTLDATQVDPEYTVYNAFVARKDRDGADVCYGGCLWGEFQFNFIFDTSDGTSYDLCRCSLTPIATPDGKTIIYNDESQLATAVSGWSEDGVAGTILDGTFTENTSEEYGLENIDGSFISTGESEYNISLSGTINYTPDGGTAKVKTFDEEKLTIESMGGTSEFRVDLGDSLSLLLYGTDSSWPNTALVINDDGILTGVELRCDALEEIVHPILNKYVDIDNKTVTLDTSGQISTTLGGWKEFGTDTEELFVDTNGDGSPTYNDRQDCGWDYNTTITSLVPSGTTTATVHAKFTALGTSFDEDFELNVNPAAAYVQWESDSFTIGSTNGKLIIYDNFVGENQGGIDLHIDDEIDLSASIMESCELVYNVTTLHYADSTLIHLDNATIVADSDGVIQTMLGGSEGWLTKQVFNGTFTTVDTTTQSINLKTFAPLDYGALTYDGYLTGTLVYNNGTTDITRNFNSEQYTVVPSADSGYIINEPIEGDIFLSVYGPLDDYPNTARVFVSGGTDTIVSFTGSLQVEGDGYLVADSDYLPVMEGTDGTDVGAPGIVPMQLTTDAGKFLRADGKWVSTGTVKYLQSTEPTDGAAKDLWAKIPTTNAPSNENVIYHTDTEGNTVQVSEIRFFKPKTLGVIDNEDPTGTVQTDVIFFSAGKMHPNPGKAVMEEYYEDSKGNQILYENLTDATVNKEVKDNFLSPIYRNGYSTLSKKKFFGIVEEGVYAYGTRWTVQEGGGLITEDEGIFDELSGDYYGWYHIDGEQLDYWVNIHYIEEITANDDLIPSDAEFAYFQTGTDDWTTDNIVRFSEGPGPTPPTPDTELYVHNGTEWVNVSGSGSGGYEPDDATITLNSDDELTLADRGVTFSKLASQLVTDEIPTRDPSELKVTTEKGVFNALANKENKIIVQTDQPTTYSMYDMWAAPNDDIVITIDGVQTTEFQGYVHLGSYAVHKDSPTKLYDVKFYVANAPATISTTQYNNGIGTTYDIEELTSAIVANEVAAGRLQQLKSGSWEEILVVDALGEISEDYYAHKDQWTIKISPITDIEVNGLYINNSYWYWEDVDTSMMGSYEREGFIEETGDMNRIQFVKYSTADETDKFAHIDSFDMEGAGSYTLTFYDGDGWKGLGHTRLIPEAGISYNDATNMIRAKVDNATIVADDHGYLKTALGGFKQINKTWLFMDTKGDGSPTYIESGSTKAIGWDCSNKISTEFAGDNPVIHAKFTALGEDFDQDFELHETSSIPKHWGSDDFAIGSTTAQITVFEDYIGANRGGIGLTVIDGDITNSIMEECYLITDVIIHYADSELIHVDQKTIVTDSDGIIETTIGGWSEDSTSTITVCEFVSSQTPEAGTNKYICAMSGAVADIPTFTSPMNFVISGTAGGTDVSGTYAFTETASGSQIYTYSMTSPLPESTWTLDFTDVSMGDGKVTAEFTNPQAGNLELVCETEEMTVEIIHKIDGKFIGIDNDTIKYDSANNQLYADIDEVDLGVVADSYSASSTYAVNDVVIYNNKLYRNKTAITTAESFDATKWYEISVDNGMYLHSKIYPTTHAVRAAGSIAPPVPYNMEFTFSDEALAAYTTGIELTKALFSAGYTGTNILTATGTIQADTVTGVNVSYDGTEYTFNIYTNDTTTPAGTITQSGLDGMTVTDTAEIGAHLHPSAPDVNFSDADLFPTLASINTYVNNNPNQIVTMKSMYSMVMRFFGRSYVGTTLSMSTALGDEFDATTKTLIPADDCTFTGPTNDRTLVIP